MMWRGSSHQPLSINLYIASHISRNIKNLTSLSVKRLTLGIMACLSSIFLRVFFIEWWDIRWGWLVEQWTDNSGGISVNQDLISCSIVRNVSWHSLTASKSEARKSLKLTIIESEYPHCVLKIASLLNLLSEAAFCNIALHYCLLGTWLRAFDENCDKFSGIKICFIC